MRMREALRQPDDADDEVRGSEWVEDFGGLVDDLNELMELPDGLLRDQLTALVRKRRTWEILRRRFHDDPEARKADGA